MHVETIDGPDEFALLQSEWDRLYAADHEAQIFLSHSFQSGLQRLCHEPGFMLVVRRSASEGQLLAALPLRVRRTVTANGEEATTLTPAGGAMCDYNGLLCDPECDPAAIRALADAVADLRHSHLRLNNLRISDRRLRTLLHRLAARGATVRSIKGVRNADGIDNASAPRVDLLGDWDKYVATLQSSNARQKMRRLLRKLDAEDGLLVTHTNAQTAERDLSILLHLWSERWRSRKGERTGRLAKQLGALVGEMLMRGLADILILWEGKEPLAAHALYVDRVKRTLSFAVGGRAQKSTLSPGFLLHAYAIRSAVSAGCLSYDFLRGDEAYKFTFNAKAHRLRDVLIAFAA